MARIDLPAGTVHYYLSDHLNSTSMVVNSEGIVEEESDYSPFGTEYIVTGPGANRYKFTGKERDSESGLDYFGARYYLKGLGRFITVDEGFADQRPQDPQSWNLYTYVRNNPVTYIDADGRECTETSPGHFACYYHFTDEHEKAVGEAKAWGNLILGPLAFTPPGLFYSMLTGRLPIFRPTNRDQKKGMNIAGVSLGLSGSVAGFTVEEQAIADMLAAEEGVTVTPIEPVQGQKNADAVINGTTQAEFKTIGGTGPNTIKNAIEGASEQTSQRIIINAKNVPATRAQALQQAARADNNLKAQGKPSVQGRVTIFTGEGTVRY